MVRLPSDHVTPVSDAESIFNCGGKAVRNARTMHDGQRENSSVQFSST